MSFPLIKLLGSSRGEGVDGRQLETNQKFWKLHHLLWVPFLHVFLPFFLSVFGLCLCFSCTGVDVEGGANGLACATDCFFSICCRNEAAFTCLYCCKDIDYCLAPVPLIFERCANQRSSAADRISPEQQHYAIMLNSALLRNVIIIGCARAGKMCSSALFHRFPKPRCHSRNALRRCPLRKSIKLRPHLMQHWTVFILLHVTFYS